MIGRKHGHQSVVNPVAAHFVQHVNRGQPNGCGGIAADRFRKHLRTGTEGNCLRTCAACSRFVTTHSC